ncbi:hypothetical protein HGA92_02585 [Candidatus Gracilibacteria bacterium]|nr:hypothetical protein [Candidatus Gracilibacteria bacterium]NUJ99341.1 hypothetical protein [Candidatus Gracilibacteria bacterium]
MSIEPLKLGENEIFNIPPSQGHKEGELVKELLDFRYHTKNSLQPVKVQGCKNLFSGVLEKFQGFEGIDIAFQYTKKGGKISAHKHTGEQDTTDELICLIEGTYGNIGNFENNNGIIKIASGEEHGGKSHGTWMSIKPRGYNLVEQNEYGIIYEKGGKKILISRGKILEKHKLLLYKNNLLMIDLGVNNVSIGKIGKDNLREQNGEFILIGETY